MPIIIYSYLNYYIIFNYIIITNIIPYYLDQSFDNINVMNNNFYNISIDLFQVITTLGYGTFGRVKLVRLRNTKEVFALKIMKKSDIIKQRQVQHIKSEKDILMELNHPFIVSLKTSFQDSKRVYMLFQYIPGGQLFSRLTKSGRFSNDITIFYVSEIVEAICYLHSHNIIFRDLKPQNIMIDTSGHAKIIDLGFAKKLDHGRTFTLCGTPEYLAPQVLKQQNAGYGKAVDYWGIGILTYELLAGYPPFYDSEEPKNIYKKIVRGVIQFPTFFSLRAKDIIIKLLNPDPQKRLGINDNGESIKQHLWFRRVEWQKISKKLVRVPWKPNLKSKVDASNFEEVTQSISSPSTIGQRQELLFEDF